MANGTSRPAKTGGTNETYDSNTDGTVDAADTAAKEKGLLLAE